MNKDEYLELIKLAEDECAKRLNQIRVDYAHENNPYNIGDKITDHIGSGIIRKIGVHFGHFFDDLPSCFYVCDNLTKKGFTNRREPVRRIYQQNIIKNKE